MLQASETRELAGAVSVKNQHRRTPKHDPNHPLRNLHIFRLDTFQNQDIHGSQGLESYPPSDEMTSHNHLSMDLVENVRGGGVHVSSVLGKVVVLILSTLQGKEFCYH